jgi:hypothetical protein
LVPVAVADFCKAPLPQYLKDATLFGYQPKRKETNTAFGRVELAVERDTALYLAVDLSTYVPRTPAYPHSKKVTGFDIVKRLLAAGVDVDAQLNQHRPGRGGNSERFTDDLLTGGATPLLRAAITHDHDSMKALLEHGADVNLPNFMGITPLMAAAGLGVRNINFGANRSPNFEEDKEIETKAIASGLVELRKAIDEELASEPEAARPSARRRAG